MLATLKEMIMDRLGSADCEVLLDWEISREEAQYFGQNNLTSLDEGLNMAYKVGLNVQLTISNQQCDITISE